MNSFEVQEHFTTLCEKEPDSSAAVMAISTMTHVIQSSSVETVQELQRVLLDTVAAMRRTQTAVASVQSACELFMRFITFTALDHSDFTECKRVLLERAEVFQQKVVGLRSNIARRALPFIREGARLLVHSRSRTVLLALHYALKHGRSFSCLVTEARPGPHSGEDMCAELAKLGVPATLVLDAAVGYVMEQVDMVLLGAEAVVESGGIINKVGSYTVALCAKAHNKPVYVLAESFKFLREFPLSQSDLKDDVKYGYRGEDDNLTQSPPHPLVDYTPPGLVTLLFTDLGTLTPSAVSDELIKLYL